MFDEITFLVSLLSQTLREEIWDSGTAGWN